MAEEKTEEEKKITLEREYIVPLRSGWLKVPKYRRGKKAIKTLKEFIAQHMKVYDRDLRKIKVDILLNNEIEFRGMRKPPAKIKVKAIKYDDGTVGVKLVTLPKHIEFELARKARKEVEKLKEEEKKEKETPKPAEEKKKEEEKPEEKKEDKIEAKEKEASSKLAEEKIEKQQAKQMKHTSITSQKQPRIQRKSLKK